MGNMKATHADSEVLIPDQVIDDRFHTLIDSDDVRGSIGAPATLTRRQKFAATLLLVVLTVAAFGVAAVVAVGAIVVAAVLLVVGIVTRIAVAISGETRR